MIPCTPVRWLLAVRCVGLNGEPIRPAWGLTERAAIRRWMRRYDAWCAAGCPQGAT